MRRYLGPLLGLVVVIAAVFTLWTYHLSSSHGASSLVLAEVSGRVTLTGPNDAAPVEASTGIELAPLQRVATGEDARVVLALGRDTRVRLGPASSVQVRDIDEEGVRLELEDGALQATVRPTSGALRVANRGRELLVTDADLQAGVRGDDLAFEVDRGEAMVLGVEGASSLQEGQRLLLPAANGALFTEVPDALLLTVQWPEQQVTREESLSLRGTTEPGALVSASGGAQSVSTTADAHGAFDLSVPLREGENALVVEAAGLLGQRKSDEGEVEKDTRAPVYHGGATEYGRP